LAQLEQFHTTLGDYLDAGAYGAAFRRDHLLPMAASIWSAPAATILDYPAAAFIRFQDSHGLLRLRNRPPWRTVLGGSRAYVERLTKTYADRIRLAAAVTSVHRQDDRVKIRDCNGCVETFDDVVIAAHADQALAMLDTPTPEERRLLGAIRYCRNVAVLHSDDRLMPRRRAVWASWNHIGGNSDEEARDCPTVTYWMNSLQRVPHDTPLFVTLNPKREPRQILHQEIYDHPLFDSAAITAQRQLWSLQGRRNTWFCGAYFGAGFHEDGLQAGLAVAESLGRVRRPWTVANESGRIALDRQTPPAARELVA
jgi:predicted NAD/FAD-binding protein